MKNSKLSISKKTIANLSNTTATKTGKTDLVTLVTSTSLL